MKQKDTMPSHGDNSATKDISRRSFVKNITQVGAGFIVTLAVPSMLVGCGSTAEEVIRGERTINDDMGRDVTIPSPDNLEKIFFTSALAMVFCFSLKPEIMGGTSYQFTEEELRFFPPEMKDLPYLGTLNSEEGTLDYEMLIAEGIQVVFSISGVALTNANLNDAQSLESKTNIPVVMINGSFDQIWNAYRLLGECLGEEEKAEESAQFLQGIYEDVTAAIATVPEDERISLYYAEGPEGLQTEPDSSQHGLTFKVGGAKNVAAVEENQGKGMSDVSLEQIILWDPEVIVAWSNEVRGGADEDIRSNPNWSDLKAVKDVRVYTMPNVPFAWCDRPPGVNRFIGLQWVANMLYPDVYDVDMVQETIKFYEQLYHREVTEEDVLAILGNSYPPYGK